MKLPAMKGHVLPSTAMLALVLVMQAFSLLAPLDRFLSDQRFRLADRPVSDRIVFVAIDKKSLDEVGVWPWPRSVHSAIADRLREFGAREIVFDIDFSTPSTPEGDAAFAAAIERAAGTVTLPVFLQRGAAGSGDANIEMTEPIEAFARNAWLASVNVYPDSDGKVRTFPTGVETASGFLASVPATIAGTAVPPNGEILVDFGLDPHGFTTISASDLLDGTADAASVEGRTVVIGAFATELRDFYAVPNHDFIQGAVLQGLAAETLIAGRNLRQIAPMKVALPAFFVLLALMVGLSGQTSLQTILTFASIPIAAEAVAAVLYLTEGVMAPTAFIDVAALTALAVRSLSMTELFRRLSREAAAEARNTRRVLQQVVRENFDAIVVIDEDMNALQVSEAVGTVFDLHGALPEAGSPVVDFLPANLSHEIYAAIFESRRGIPPRPEARTFFLKAGDGCRRAIEYTIGISELGKTTQGRNGRDGTAPRGMLVACLTARDVTERLTYQEKLQWLSDHDDMTGTWRRHAFIKVIDRAMKEHRGGLAIIAFNLHRFKTVNVTLGRETGNVVLRAVAQRLDEGKDRCCGAARLSGDTFAVIVSGIRTEADAQDAANRIIESIGAPYPVARGSAKVGVQAGVTLCQAYGAEHANAEALLEHAEMALDEARVAGGSRVVFHDEALATQRRRSRIIERDLWQAVERGEIHLAYQLQVGLSDGAPRGAEALVRWTHPVLGNVGPDEFIRIAEVNGFISTLGRWILFTACREAAQWPEELSVAVNVAPQQFLHDDIVDEVRDALAESGLKPERLTIEIVESELLETADSVLDRILALKALGVRLALDDFGTGYSGISYLSRLRFDKIKIDKQFVRDLTTNVETQGIIRSVALLGDSFDMTVVCEGIETREQEAFLRLIGCDEGQGYLYSRPIEASAFRALIAGKQDGRAALA
ncbi:MAG: hypothetical protein CL535_21345 [Ahrensia sp.]|nr:hypothetical protein [Ahrensia sp.]|tara:strand:+ start:14123 stop:16939 length:2817 start_codon:yes stop_codon:yes gene_type:complete